MRTVRESELCQSVCWALGLWGLLFGVALGYWGDNVTSKQWLYLLSVPGHQWTWEGVFGTSGLLIVIGLLKQGRYLMRSLGCLGVASGCLAITALYAAAPLIDPGLLTFGSFAWILGAGAGYLLAVINWRPITWF